MDGHSLVDRLQIYFVAHEGEWIDGKILGTVAGSYGWRTRCSDLRKRGMVIENRLRRMQDAITGQRWTVSEYRFVKPAPVANAQAVSLGSAGLMGPYAVIIADPPWSYNNTGCRGAAENGDSGLGNYILTDEASMNSAEGDDFQVIGSGYEAGFDAGYDKGFADGLDESAGDPRVERIESGFTAMYDATNGEFSIEDMIVMDALNAGREFAVRLARREQHIQQLIGERADLKRWLVLALQAHAKEHGWQDVDEPIAALLSWCPVDWLNQ